MLANALVNTVVNSSRIFNSICSLSTFKTNNYVKYFGHAVSTVIDGVLLVILL